MRRNQIVLLGIAVVGGFLLRISVATFDAPDSLYHLRRAVFAVEHFPRTIVVDPLINFPGGGVVIWPPLFDLTLALPALAVAGSDASQELVARTAAWVPPVYAAMTILLTGLAGLGLNRRWGAAAALVVAILPGHLEYSMLGRTDQHVAEAFWAAALLCAVIWAAKRQSPLLEATAGICMAGAVLNWQGGIFWGPVIGAAFVAGAWLPGADRQWPRRTLLSLGLPVVITAAASWFWIGDFDLPFTYISFGWFQSVFLAATFAVAALLITVPLVLRRQRAGAAGFVTLIGIVASGTFVALIGSELFLQIRAGVEHLGSVSQGRITESGAYLSYPAAWLSRIREYDPLLADGGWSLSWISFAFFAAPLALFRWLRELSRSPRNYHYAVLVTSTLFILLFTLSQRRNVYYAAVVASLVAVEVSAWLGVILRRKYLDHRQRRRGATPVFVALLVVMLLPVLVNYPKEVLAGYGGGERAETFRVAGILADSRLDPYDDRFLVPDAEIPELAQAESIMAFWSQGHLATWYAEIPVVANNFGYGYLDSLEFYFSEDEENAIEIARDHRVRWVVVFDLLPVFESYGDVLGQSGYVMELNGGLVPTARYFRTLHGRLYETDGRGGVHGGHTIQPLEHFRLRWSSEETVPRHPVPIPRFKIFEIVD